MVRIALTGGPCAGKSSALAEMLAAATASGFDVYLVPETATTVFKCAPRGGGLSGIAPRHTHHAARSMETFASSSTRIGHGASDAHLPAHAASGWSAGLSAHAAGLSFHAATITVG